MEGNELPHPDHAGPVSSIEFECGVVCLLEAFLKNGPICDESTRKDLGPADVGLSLDRFACGMHFARAARDRLGWINLVVNCAHWKDLVDKFGNGFLHGVPQFLYRTVVGFSVD